VFDGQSNIHQDTLNRIIFLRFMLITFDEKSFLDEYENKQRIVDSTTQNVKVTFTESVQNVERCNEKNCNDVNLRQYLQGINDGMDILLSLRNIPQIKPIENMIAMFQVILCNSAQIYLSYANGMIKYQTYQRICYIRNLLKYFDEEAFQIYCKDHLIALNVNVELVWGDNSSKKRTAFSSPSLSDLTSHSCSRTSVKRIRTTTKISMTSNESLNSSNSHTPTKISCSSISGRESLKQSLTNKNHNTEHSSSSTSSITTTAAAAATAAAESILSIPGVLVEVLLVVITTAKPPTTATNPPIRVLCLLLIILVVGRLQLSASSSSLSPPC